MNNVCGHCQAKTFKKEVPGLCCSQGKVLPTPFPDLPPVLADLFSGSSPKSVQFLRHIRTYNGCFAMTSFGHKEAGVVRGWNPTFTVQGQVCSYDILHLQQETLCYWLFLSDFFFTLLRFLSSL